MTLFNTLNTALSGLRAAQSGIDVIARNVSNAGVAGYSRKTLPLQTTVLNGQAVGVQTLAVQREVDSRLFAQATRQVSVTARHDAIGQFLSRLDQMFGQPDQDTSISAGVKRLGTAFQDLADHPEVAAIRQKALDEAAAMAGDLNAMSDQIQAMRKEAEDAIAVSVDTINDALHNINRLNGQIGERTISGQSTADLEDQRDLHLRRLSEQIGVRFVTGDKNRIAVFTEAGRTLLDGGVNELVYTPASSVTAHSSYDNGLVGAIRLANSDVDMIARGELKQGVLSGLVELRDTLLPQAQAQLDELAHALALQLSSDPQRVGTATSAQITTAGLGADGDSLTLNYRDATGSDRVLTVNFVDVGAGVIEAQIDTDGDGTPDITALADDNADLTDVQTLAALQSVVSQALNAGLPTGQQWSASFVPGSDALTIQAPFGATVTSLSTATATPASGAIRSGSTALLDTTNFGLVGDAITFEHTDSLGAKAQVHITLEAQMDTDGDGAIDFVANGATDDQVLTAMRNLLGGALGPDWTVGFAPGGRQLMVQAPNGTRIDGMRSFTQLGLGVPLFVDSGVAGQRAYQDLKAPNYTSVPQADQKAGFAGRITVNAALLADTTKLVTHQERRDGATTLTGGIVTSDVGSSARAIEMEQRLTVKPFTFSASSGIGGAGTPYTGTLELFASNVVSYQAMQVSANERRLETETKFSEILTQRLDGQSGVNIDDELSQLMLVQNAYGASARVMNSVQSMLDELMGMIR